MVPALEVDGVATPIMHMRHIASLLGLPAPDDADQVQLAQDLLALYGSWVALLRPLSWETLNDPTPSRGRSIRALVVDALHWPGLLPGAWTTHDFPRGDASDDERVLVLLDSPAATVAHAEGVRDDWRAFVLEHEDALASDDPTISTPRGPLLFSNLLATLRRRVPPPSGGRVPRG
jgi:hypothetical protein